MKNITREKAIKLGESEFWKPLNHRERAMFQLFTDKLCMPFSVFHEAVEKTLDRPVYTHEFGSAGTVELKKEILGEKETPTLEDILNLIPEAKRRVILI